MLSRGKEAEGKVKAVHSSAPATFRQCQKIYDRQRCRVTTSVRGNRTQEGKQLTTFTAEDRTSCPGEAADGASREQAEEPYLMKRRKNAEKEQRTDENT